MNTDTNTHIDPSIEVTLPRAAAIVFASTSSMIPVYANRAFVNIQTKDQRREIVRGAIERQIESYEREYRRNPSRLVNTKPLLDRINELNHQLGEMVRTGDIPEDSELGLRDTLLCTNDERTNIKETKVILGDFVNWCLPYRLPVPNRFVQSSAASLELRTRRSPGLAELDSWTVIDACFEVFGVVGHNWENDRRAFKFPKMREELPDSYETYQRTKRKTGVSPLSSAEFALAKTPEFMKVRSAITMGKIKASNKELIETCVVDPKSFLEWVKSKGFEIPEHLVSILTSEEKEEALDAKKADSILPFRDGGQNIRINWWTTIDGKLHMRAHTSNEKSGIATFLQYDKQWRLVWHLLSAEKHAAPAIYLVNEIYDGNWDLAYRVANLVADVRRKFRKTLIPPEILSSIFSTKVARDTNVEFNVRKIECLDLRGFREQLMADEEMRAKYLIHQKSLTWYEGKPEEDTFPYDTHAADIENYESGFSDEDY